ncbi:SCO family protein [Catalinimonas sp. 4WD22]|uniref:SCO family protein n=1 Tax=Catalinimonas locisalis TaxID=3133978 RepID=UPI0031013DF2
MNKKLKTGILLLTLAIPVFIWLFLKFFGSNNFDLPVYYSQGIDTIADCSSENKPHTLPDFVLTQINGENLSSEALKGKILLSYFLPEQCEDSCKLVLEMLANIQSVLAQEQAFKILVIAGENYSTDELASFKSRFNANAGEWDFLKGEEQKVNYLKKCGFVLSSDQDFTLILTDSSQRIRGYYNGVDSDEIDRLKGEVKILEYMQEVAYHD